MGCGMHLAIMMWSSVSSKKLDLVRNSVMFVVVVVGGVVVVVV